MTVKMYLKIDGINGESADAEHKNEMDVLAWDWNVANSASTHVDQPRQSTQASFGDISITKYIDDATPELLLAVANATTHKKATLEIEKLGGRDEAVDFVVVELGTVLVNSYATGGSDGEDRLTETITLNFANVELKYFKTTSKGKVKATKPTFKWDIRQGKSV